MDGLTRLEQGNVNASSGQTKFYKDEIQWRPLGGGSFGDIHIVDRMHGFGKVVVKEFKELSKISPERLEILEGRELEFVLKLCHPNILKLYGFLYEKCSPNKRIGFVTEYMESGSLSTAVHNCELFYEESNVLSWALQAARGLAFCHVNKMVHRDVKPDNMLLSSSGILKICNIGLSRETSCVGSIMYMAPEVMSGKSYDYKCDVYSLALTIWEMYHRRSPATGRNPIAFQRNVQRGSRPPFEYCPIHMEEDIPRFIQSCWETDPIKRTDLRDVLNFLESKWNHIEHTKQSCVHPTVGNNSKHTPNEDIVPTVDNSSDSSAVNKFFLNKFNRTTVVDYGSQGIVSTGFYTGRNTIRAGILCDFFAYKEFINKNQDKTAERMELFLIRFFKHKNLVRFFGMLYRDESAQKPCGYVMEYIKYSMNTVIHDRICYKLRDIIHWFSETASALDYLHQRDVVHRDVKPPNILISACLKEVRVCDFGTSRPQETVMTAGLGTLHYMAPELFEGEQVEYDTTCDVYSFGISLWEAFHQRPPYKGFPFDGIKSGSLRPLIDSGLFNGKTKDLVTRCWSSCATTRPSMEHVLTALRDIRDHYTEEQLNTKIVSPAQIIHSSSE